MSSDLRLRRPLATALLGLLVAGAVTSCGSAEDPGAATVVDVVDGQTVHVKRAGDTVTVRLLGIDAPRADECLAAESADALGALLPAGADIRLEPVDAADGADDVVAAVYADDVLINAELVRRGLGNVAVDAAGPISDEVVAARDEAVEAGAGLFGTDADCTVPAQVAALEEAGAEAADASGTLVAGAGLDEVDRRGAAVMAAVATGSALAALLDGEASDRYPEAMVAQLRSRTGAVNDRLGGATAAVQQVRGQEEQRIEAERVAAEAERVAAETARVAAETAAAQAAADEAARQAKAAADAEAARVAAETTTKAPAASSGGSTYYKNCDAVRAAGADPIYAGQPGYSSKLDRDGDGIACE